MEMMSNEVKDLMTALALAQKVMQGATKDSNNPFFKSKYADLASVWDACRAPLADNGLSVAQLVQPFEGNYSLVTILGHTSGQWMKSIIPLPLDKVDPQSLGKCITYCRRYALAAMVGVYQEDDDAESITDHNKKKSPTPAPQSQLPKNEKLVVEEKTIEEFKTATLDKAQIEEIRKLLNGNTSLKEEVLQFVNKKLVSDIPQGLYNPVLNFIKVRLKQEKVA